MCDPGDYGIDRAGTHMAATVYCSISINACHDTSCYESPVEAYMAVLIVLDWHPNTDRLQVTCCTC